jgi:K+-transporting ATPase ATPase C chain
MKNLKPAFLLSITLLVICGLIYPLTMTCVSQVVFNNKANGSMIDVDGKVVGSKHIGQDFTDLRFFHGRVSAMNYNTYEQKDLIKDEDGNTAYKGISSGSQNLAPSNPDLQNRVEEDIRLFLKDNPTIKKEEIPTDLLTSSGSGLDPNISPQSAIIQIPRIADKTGISESEVKEIVKNNTYRKVLGIFGEDKVNVLEANIDIAKKLNIL